MATINLARDHSLDAIGIQSATIEGIKRFATRRWDPPYANLPDRGIAKENDLSLYHCIRRSVEAAVADSASDEIKALHMLQRSTATTDNCKLENLKLVVRDKTHSTRRNATRNYKADAFLDEVQNNFVFGEKSPIRLIQNSPTFKSWFTEHIKAMADRSKIVAQNGRGIKDLNFRAHRFDSTQKPFARIVLYFYALLATIVRISRVRSKNEEGKACHNFLVWINTESALQIAMLADSGDENLILTRITDHEGFPTESLIYELAGFKERIRQLFIGAQGQPPLCMTTGFTNHMISILQQPFLINIDGGTKQIGGNLTHAIERRCLGRMANWVCLCESTLAAEFPDFETVQAWGAFYLAADEINPHTVYQQIVRLNAAFDLGGDVDEIMDQHAHFHPIARQIHVQEGLSSQDAWFKAFGLARRNTMVRRCHQKNALEPLLVRFWANGMPPVLLVFTRYSCLALAATHGEVCNFCKGESIA